MFWLAIPAAVYLGRAQTPEEAKKACDAYYAANHVEPSKPAEVLNSGPFSNEPSTQEQRTDVLRQIRARVHAAAKLGFDEPTTEPAPAVPPTQNTNGDTMNFDTYHLIASAVHSATHNLPEAKTGFSDRQHAHGANGHPAYLAVRKHLGPLLDAAATVGDMK